MNSLAINHSLSFQERKEVIRHLTKVKRQYPSLQHHLYKIKKKSEEDEFTVIYTIVLNPESEIYKVHFPERPITPGSCLVEVAQELLENDLGESLCLKTIIDLNYFNPINPQKSFIIDFHIHKIEKEVKTTELEIVVRVEAGKEQFALLKLSFDR